MERGCELKDGVRGGRMKRFCATYDGMTEMT